MMVRAVLFGTMWFVASFSYAANDLTECVGDDECLRRLIKICKQLEGSEQIREFTAEVECKGWRTYWREKESGEMKLPTRFIVENKVSMKGGRYRIPAIRARVSSPPFMAECRKYEEYQVTIPSLMVTLNSCAELEELQRTGRAAFCKAKLEEAGTEEGDGELTGKIMTQCTPKGTTGQGGGLELGAKLKSHRLFQSGGEEVPILELTETPKENSILAKLGMGMGDRIVTVDGKYFNTPEELGSYLASRSGLTKWFVYIDDRGQNLELEL